MNTLIQLRHSYEAGDSRKQDFIEAIHARHAFLFDYPDFLAGTDVEALSIQSDGVFVRSRSQQIEMLLDPKDQHLVPCTLMNFRAYEIAETEFLKAVTGPDSTVLDIGANCGWYSLALARQCPRAQIHAFEPIPSTNKILLRNVRQNGFTNITVHPLAFSNKEKDLEFLYTPNCSGATSLTMAGQPESQERLERIRCPGTTLDLFCASHRLAPDIIKCDVEGAELMVIQGGEATIAKHKPVILIELMRKWALQFGYHPNDVLTLLAKYGYRAYVIDINGLTLCAGIDEETLATNFVFLHEHQHRDIFNVETSKT